MVLVLVLAMVFSIAHGRYEIGYGEVIQVLLGRGEEGRIQTLIYNIRLPRVLMVTISGMALGLAGMVYQKVFRNPLVSPDLLGASSGASLGAAFAVVCLGGGNLMIATSAFAMSILTVGFTMYLAKFIRGRVLGLVLAGIVTSAISSSILMMLKVMADPYKDLPSIEFWLMGGFYNASWEGIGTLLPFLVLGSVMLFVMGYQLQVLTLGDEAATVLGMSVSKMRLFLIGGATLLVATVVAMNGLVSWIGLIAPHIAGVFSKSYDVRGIRTQQMMAMIWGGVLLLIADTVCRTAFPTELPISVITSLIGGIVLAILLVCKSRYLNN